MQYNKYYNGVFVLAQRREILNTLGVRKGFIRKVYCGVGRVFEDKSSFYGG